MAEEPLRQMGCLPILVMLLTAGLGGALWIAIFLLIILPTIPAR
ncbi:MAG TPA: hypothetical protein VFA93_03055 [Patescibacteria group bacterium]|nr:hypothetical protein [Patescibacteria group bacterium]